MDNSQVFYPFETAPHSYFAIENFDQAKADFLEGRAQSPIFVYHERFTNDEIDDRISKLIDGTSAQRKLLLVKIAVKLQENDSYLLSFKHLNTEIYGEVNCEYFDRIIKFMFGKYSTKKLQAICDDENCRQLVEYEKSIGEKTLVNLESYRTMRKYFKRYFSGLKPSTSLDEAMQKIYKKSGLEEIGWTLEARDNNSHARTIFKNKTIIYGKNYKARSSDKFVYNSIALHEIFGHAMRETGAKADNAESSEGWAVLLEQLNSHSLKTKRAYRYLAAALATGAYNGKELNFTDTFAVIWRLMSLSGRYNLTQAKSHAFDEVARVFRGGRPDLPGAVFLKDTAYLKGNLDTWDAIEKRTIDYTDFVDIIEGRKEILG